MNMLHENDWFAMNECGKEMKCKYVFVMEMEKVF